MFQIRPEVRPDTAKLCSHIATALTAAQPEVTCSQDTITRQLVHTPVTPPTLDQPLRTLNLATHGGARLAPFLPGAAASKHSATLCQPSYPGAIQACHLMQACSQQLINPLQPRCQALQVPDSHTYSSWSWGQANQPLSDGNDILSVDSTASARQLSASNLDQLCSALAAQASLPPSRSPSADALLSALLQVAGKTSPPLQQTSYHLDELHQDQQQQEKEALALMGLHPSRRASPESLSRDHCMHYPSQFNHVGENSQQLSAVQYLGPPLAAMQQQLGAATPFSSLPDAACQNSRHMGGMGGRTPLIDVHIKAEDKNPSPTPIQL